MNDRHFHSVDINIPVQTITSTTKLKLIPKMFPRIMDTLPPTIIMHIEVYYALYMYTHHQLFDTVEKKFHSNLHTFIDAHVSE